jgi:glycosyltransferase involved in cell wall biosynthesis
VSDSVPSILLLIPAYNEEHRIGPVLDAYARVFSSRLGPGSSIVVVLNGCRDATLNVVLRAESHFPCVSHIEFKDPIGKGGALIEGLRLAPRAEFIGYVDADGATPPDAFLDLVQHAVSNGSDCVIGSRWLPESKITHLQPEKRRFASRLFHLFVEAFFRMGIADTQCGAKVIRRGAIEAIHDRLELADLAFDVNLLYSLMRGGFSITEVPTTWEDKIGSHVVFDARTSLNMLLSLVRLRLVYSPLYRWLRPLRPLEAWIYMKLRAPAPRSHPRRP